MVDASPISCNRTETGEEPWMLWPFNLRSYAPDLEYGDDILFALEEFEAELLSKETAVKCLQITKTGLVILDGVLDMKDLVRTLTTKDESRYEFL
jgi:hypothetical protein